jgi:predicted nucleic-acid-binding Zn-ribbon protein
MVCMPRGVHNKKKQGVHPLRGAQVSVRGAHLSNITYDLRFLFLRAFLHIMCIRCYFTKFYYFLPFLAMSRGSHGVITSFLVFGTFSAMANECSILIFLAFWRTAPKNPK